MTLVTFDKLRAVCPQVPKLKLAEVLVPLNAACEEFEINTPLRLKHFIAQLAHESGGFVYLRELASGKAYEGREDLGNTEFGDGPMFKGWGWMQTTGRKNTRLVSLALFGDERLIENPALINPPSLELAARAAGYFWTVGAGLNLSKRAIESGVQEGVNLNDLADKDDLVLITHAVNGWENGIDDRRAYAERGETVFA